MFANHQSRRGGDRACARLLAFTLLAFTLLAMAGALAPAAPVHAAGPRADLTVDVTTTPTEVLEAGGWTRVNSTVRNVGARGARAVSLTLLLPDGAWVFSDGWVPATGWTAPSPPRRRARTGISPRARQRRC